VNLDFIESAPLRFVNEVEINAPPENVLKVLADAASWPRFLKAVIKAEWTSSEPHGVGSTRTLILKGMTAQEHFIAWEPGKRFTFYVPEMTAPIARAICEDYRLEPVGRGKTKFSYTVACEPGLLLKLTGPVGRWLLGRMVRTVAHSLVEFVGEEGSNV